jgi:hypothetical protein
LPAGNGRGRSGETISGLMVLRLTKLPGQQFDFSLSPWSFRGDAITVEGEGHPLPKKARFADEASMRAWLSRPVRSGFRARLLAP